MLREAEWSGGQCEAGPGFSTTPQGPIYLRASELVTGSLKTGINLTGGRAVSALRHKLPASRDKGQGTGRAENPVTHPSILLMLGGGWVQGSGAREIWPPAQAGHELVAMTIVRFQSERRSSQTAWSLGGRPLFGSHAPRP